jgi:hypothetical protein
MRLRPILMFAHQTYHPESLSVCQTSGFASFRCPIAHPISIADLHLTGVAAQCFDLAFDRGGNVHIDRIWFSVIGSDVQLFDLVRLQTFGKQLRENRARWGAGKDGSDRSFGSRAVISVVDVLIAVEEGCRIAAHHAIRLEMPNQASQFAAQLEGRFENAIFIPQKKDLSDAEHPGSSALFFFTNANQFIQILVGVVTASRTIGHNTVVDLVTLVCPERGAATHAELWIVRVSKDA